MAHSKRPNRTTHRSPSKYKAALAAWNKAHQPKNGNGTTAKERLDKKQKELDEAKKPKVNKKELKKKIVKPNLVQTPSPTWGVKKQKENKVENKVENKETPKVKKKITARSRMRARNEEIHGKYPNSQTAKERKRKLKIATWRDVE